MSAAADAWESFCAESYWFEPLDWGTGRSSVNDRSAAREPDGSVRLVISARRPAAAKWLDTQGHAEGLAILRVSRSDDAPPEVATEVVRVDALRDGGRA